MPVSPAKTTGSSHVRLGSYYLNQHPNTIFTQGEWFRYGIGIWTQVAELQVRKELQATALKYAKTAVRTILLTQFTIYSKPGNSTLTTPSTATPTYRIRNDIPQVFLHERYERLEEVDEKGNYDKVQAADLYADYKHWCQNTGHKPFSGTVFAGELKRLGLEKKPPSTVDLLPRSPV